MKTFLSNLHHAMRNNETVSIGGGDFTPAELRQVVDKLAEVRQALKETTFIVESVAHLQGKERLLLPLADRARALIEEIGG